MESSPAKQAVQLPKQRTRRTRLPVYAACPVFLFRLQQGRTVAVNKSILMPDSQTFGNSRTDPILLFERTAQDRPLSIRLSSIPL
jgi:hypothetical protein